MDGAAEWACETYTRHVSIRSEPEILALDVADVSPAWTWVRWSLAGCAFVLLASALLVGQHPSTWNRLRGELASGNVTTVWVGGGLPARATGTAQVQVRWHDGLLWRTTQVLEVRGTHTPQGAGRGDGASVVVRGDVGARLAHLQPRLNVIHESYPSGMSGTVLGWEVPGWTVLGTLLVWMASAALLAFHPRPWWRATRWAWFWLIMLMPVGTLAFLVLAGPTPLVPGPRNPVRRLTGGWAFLLTLILGAGLAS